MTSPGTSSWNWLQAALPTRTGAEWLVAAEPAELDLGQPALALDPVHDLQLRRLAGDGAEEPLAPGAGLVDVAGVHHRQQGEGGVAEPAEAVVPVADPAELLGEAGRRRRHDPAGRRVGQGLQGDQRPLDRVGPSLFVGRPVAGAIAEGAAVGPLAPPALGVVEGRGVVELARGSARWRGTRSGRS